MRQVEAGTGTSAAVRRGRAAERFADRLAALDPGRVRWRSAWAATVCLGAALAVEYFYVHLLFPDRPALTPMLFGGVAAMQGSAVVVQRSAAARLRHGLAQCAAAGLGLSVGVLVFAAFGSGRPLDVCLVVATFPAVAVRRAGPAFGVLGLIAWAACYSATIFKPPPAQLPFLLSAEIVSGVCAGLVAAVLFRHRPRAAAQHALRAWAQQRTAVLRACVGLLEPGKAETGCRGRSWRRRLTARQHRLTHTALVVEGRLAELGPGSAGAAAATRHRLLEVQAAVDAIAFCVLSLTAADGEGASARYADACALLAGERAEARAAVAEILRPLARGDGEAAHRAALRLLDGPAHADVRRLALAVAAVAEADRTPPPDLQADLQADDGEGEFTAVVAASPSGALPSAAGLVAAVTGAGGRRRGHRRPGPFHVDLTVLTTRQAVQATLAMAITAAFARLVSPDHSYWSLIAVFIVFLGPATREELVVKGRDRVLGTLAGAVVAVPVHALLGTGPAVVITLLLACCLLGHFLMHWSYAPLAFLITVCVFELYASMGQYETGMLLVRLTQTAFGAAVAIGVACLVLPAAARDSVVLGRLRFHGAVAELLDHIGDPPSPAAYDHARLGALARTADEHARTLAAAALPLTQPGSSGRGRVRAETAQYLALAARLRGLTVSLRQEGADPAAADMAVVRRLARGADGGPVPSPLLLPPRAGAAGGRAPDPTTHHVHHVAALLHQLRPTAE